MRIAVVIILLAAIAVGVVNIRRMELSARHQMRLLEMRCRKLRRQLDGQEVDLGRLVALDEVRRRAEEMGLKTIDRDNAQYHLVSAQAERKRNQP